MRFLVHTKTQRHIPERSLFLVKLEERISVHTNCEISSGESCYRLIQENKLFSDVLHTSNFSTPLCTIVRSAKIKLINDVYNDEGAIIFKEGIIEKY